MQQMMKFGRRTNEHRIQRAASAVGAAALGAGVMYLGDPVSGGRRRAMARDRLMATFRSMGRFGHGLGAQTHGVVQHAKHLQPEDWSVPNDATLTQRVESELFRDPEIPKGRINLNAEAGFVVLRGELDSPEQVCDIAAKAERIPGVRGVRNLMHTTGTPAPVSL
jgi:osmotically-inducible protein OsmY